MDNLQYSCQSCNFQTHIKTHLDRHFKTKKHIIRTKPILCHFCNYTSHDLVKFRLHHRYNHNKSSKIIDFSSFTIDNNLTYISFHNIHFNDYYSILPSFIFNTHTRDSLIHDLYNYKKYHKFQRHILIDIFTQFMHFSNLDLHNLISFLNSSHTSEDTSSSDDSIQYTNNTFTTTSCIICNNHTKCFIYNNTPVCSSTSCLYEIYGDSTNPFKKN